MNEIYQMIMILGSATLFRLGGYRWKVLRRFGIPILFAIILALNGYTWHLLALLPLAGVLCMGYGDKDSPPYWVKFLIACGYTAPSLAFGLSWWQLIFPFIFIFMFWASNFKPLERTFVWGVCEIIMGILLGIAYSVFQIQWI